MSGPMLGAAAWLLTYAVHSTILFGVACVLARLLRGEAWKETLWKAALVGGILTSGAQAALGYRTLVEGWALAQQPAASAQAPASSQAPPLASNPSASSSASPSASTPGSPPPEVPAARAVPPGRGVPREARDASGPLPPSEAQTAPVEEREIPWLTLALGAWGIVAAGLLGRLVHRQARLHRMLRGRREVEDAAVLSMLAELRRNAGVWTPVRLTSSDAAPTPLALGAAEICVPTRFLSDLRPEEQRGALAHELAHVARRDPAWHLAAGVLEAVFFFQPLNRVARLRLREAAEYLCDDWAVRQTGSPLGLARCLAEVAGWLHAGRDPIPAGTMARAEGGSPLSERVRRLLGGGAG